MILTEDQKRQIDEFKKNPAGTEHANRARRAILCSAPRDTR